tara:strand:+ start:1224 stop:2090 length:867 start_codon:yes stop_codon:yes gene_type:complete
MAYIAAKDVPLYFGSTVNSNNAPTEADVGNRGVVATQVQLNYTPNITPTRVVGKEPSKDSFNLAGPPNATLSFSAYVGATAEFDITDYTGDQTVGTSFAIGDIANGIKGSGAYLTSYSMTVTPYAPVIFQADFAIYNPLTTTSEGGFIADAGTDGVIDALNFGSYGHGVYSTFNDTNLDNIDVVESVTYQYQAQRLPIYKIGAYNIQTAQGGAELITAQHSFQVQGDNIQKLVPITGSNPGSISLVIKNVSTTSLLTATVDGRLNAENVTLAGGDLARGSVTITELLV